MDLLVTVDERSLFLVIQKVAEPGRIAERIAQVFPHITRMDTCSEPGIIFGTKHQVLLLTCDNIHRIHLVHVGGGILHNRILVRTVECAQRPSVAH